MTVNNSWLVNVSVSINNTVVQPPNFNACALVGVMSVVPSTWTGTTYQIYTSLSVFIADFTALQTTSLAVFDYAQAQNYQYLLNAGAAFFSQSPTPTSLTVFAMRPPSNATNYTTVLSAFAVAQNNFYGFSICDYILANSYSYVIASITCTAGTTIPSGTVLTPETATSSYTTINDFILPAAGTYLIPFYSPDASTAIPASTFTNVSPVPPHVTTVTNLSAGVVGVPGYTTATNGIIVALVALRSDSNQKKLFADFNDYLQAGIIQTAGGSEDLTCFYHSLNFGDMPPNPGLSASLAAAVLSEYFTNVFAGSNGLTIISSMQLSGQPTDPVVNTSNIGMPGVPGSSTNFIGLNNNVYPAFGSSSSGIGLVQYGFQSNSKPNPQVYLDQVVGADYVQFTVQANLVTLLLNSLPSGIPYSDLGIQQIVNNFKMSLNQAVGQNILQPFQNSAITATPYALIPSIDITNRVYKDLSFTGKFLSRIQMIQVYINLSI